MNSIKYFSVESRKGGVGKTTVAIELCDLLLERGYRVLLIDLDLSGTKLSSTYLEGHKDTILEVAHAGESANLVLLYKDLFLSGRSLPGFSEEKNNHNYLTVSRYKCNYLASDIYCKGKTGELVMLEDPKVLNDSFHSYWMRNLIVNLSVSFARAMGKDERIAIVLDNAPGFSSMEDMVHNFLTTLGPDLGKFIIVSSLDMQDIEASRQGGLILNKIYEEKTKGAIYYHTLADRKEARTSKSPYFDEIWKELCASDGRSPDYYSKKNITFVPKQYFFQILVNKIPRHLLDSPDLVFEAGEHGVPFLRHLQDMFVPRRYVLPPEPDADMQLYRLSGEFSHLFQDNTKYQLFLSHTKRIGVHSFYKEEWGPFGAFEDIRQYYLRLEIKDLALLSVSDALSKIDLSITSERDDNYLKEIQFVEDFLKALTQDHSFIKTKIMEGIKDEVVVLFRESREDAPMVFNTQNRALQDYAELISLFCLAIYRVHYYHEICELLNTLISLCITDVRILEQLDRMNMMQFVGDALEGFCRFGEVMDNKLLDLVSSRINARELRSIVSEILNDWKV